MFDMPTKVLRNVEEKQTSSYLNIRTTQEKESHD